MRLPQTIQDFAEEEEKKHALVAEVARRTAGLRSSVAMPVIDVKAFTRAKVEPMVRGLSPREEQELVLRLLEQSVVFVTPASIEQILLDCSWLDTAWDVANLYLFSLGAELLSKNAPKIVGLSNETTCFVSTSYFNEPDLFADFVVHEVAHVFHSCKRARVGLPRQRRREWLLEIDYRKRETFAYACEVFSRVVELARRPAERAILVEEYARTSMPINDRVDNDELLDVLREAARARNGWKRILARCAQRRERRATLR